MTPARFRWGMMLILFGLLILLNNIGVIDFWFHNELFVVFLAVFLIAVGIEKIFTKSKLQFISYLTTFGIFFCGLAFAFISSGISSDSDFFTKSDYREEMQPEVKRINAVLYLDKSDLEIRDAGDDLVYCAFDKYTRKPKIKSFIDDNETAQINMAARDYSYLGGAIKIEPDRHPKWYMEFSKDVPLDLECNGADNDDIQLNLSTSRLESLKLNTDNANIYLKLGNIEPFTQVTVIGDESKLHLRLPKEIGIKIFGESYRTYLTTYLEKFGLLKEDDSGFINEQYKDAEKKIEIKLDDRLSSFSLDYY